MSLAVTITFHNTNPETIWNRLAARLGREPTRAEAASEVRRILRAVLSEPDMRHAKGIDR